MAVTGAAFSKREAILLASAAMAIVAGLTFLFSRVLTLDDAYITFRYARHLAEGYGVGAWNHAGEHVEGYSSPLWMVLLGSAEWLGIGVRTASKVFGRCGGADRDGRALPAPRRSSGRADRRLPRAVLPVHLLRRVGHGGRGVHQPGHAGAGGSGAVAAVRGAAPRRDAARGRARRRCRRALTRVAT